MNVKDRIDELRIEHGWSRTQFAAKLGISTTAVKNWYNENDYYPSFHIIEDICELFNITKTELFVDLDFKNLTIDQATLLELYSGLTQKQKEDLIEILKIIKS